MRPRKYVNMQRRIWESSAYSASLQARLISLRNLLGIRKNIKIFGYRELLAEKHI